MSKAIEKVATGVKTAAAIYAVLGVKVDVSDQHGDVQSVKLFGLLPLFRRNADGKARVLGIRARRLDR